MDNQPDNANNNHSPGWQYFVDRQHMNMAYGGEVDARDWDDLSDEEKERYEALAENAKEYE